MATKLMPFRWLLTLVFVAAGAAHFFATDALAQIVPSFLPNPRVLVYVSGVCEIAGGIALQLRPLRRLAAWGLFALLLAVFPANINQAVNHIQNAGSPVPELVFWLRLPLQLVLLAWAYRYTRPDAPAR